MSTGGFAATVSIHQRLFQLLLRATYNAGLATPQLVMSNPGASARIFFALPQVRIGGFPDAGGMFFDLEGWGPFTLGPLARKVKMRMTMRALAMVEVVAGELSVNVDIATLEFTNLSIDPYSGGLFSQPELDLLASDPFRAALLQAMRGLFVTINAVLKPFSLEFIGSLAAEPSLTARAAYAPETLLVGLDVDNDEISTSGTGPLTDETRGHEIGIWVSPRALPSAFGLIRTKIEDGVAEQGAVLEALSIVPYDGYIEIIGRASKSGGSVNFSVKARPRLKRPDTVDEWHEQYGEHFVVRYPGAEEIWFEMDDIQVDITRPWWAVGAEILASMLSFGLGAAVMEAYVSMIRGNIESGIEDGETPDSQLERYMSRRNREFTLIGVTRPKMQLRVEELESHAEGLYTGIRIRPDMWWGAELGGTYSISAEEAAAAAPRFVLKLPVDVLMSDPELRVAWTVRRRDTNEIILQRDVLAAGSLSIGVDGSMVDFLAIDALLVDVRLYRTLGAEIDNIYSGTVTMPVTDYVDRSHPFVRWSHQTVVPIVRVEPGGSQTSITEVAVGRNSAIHRTAIPGRCRMLRNYSLDRVLPRNGPPFELEYLDSLPFPIEDIAQHRSGLCDYCFFGGPTKTDPLI
ncbi:hypothetical protein [Altererythrobacter sp. Root672]|uniref:hypothetical protein n=1 Tax=Altererythrobacter sp. Root672 TaxID=1736584 RepID=UPI0006F1DCB4|nr:hypothetical protein [Altererythrobacter sp. Root672]KRA84500.1 hypothetical protein ASD76_11145 [Altererythrobacter sp. Root672]